MAFKKLIAERPGAHRCGKFITNLIDEYRVVDVVEGTSFKPEIQNQSVSALGKLSFVDASRVGQRYRSCGCRQMKNSVGAYLRDFFGSQTHSTPQPSGQRSSPSIRIM